MTNRPEPIRRRVPRNTLNRERVLGAAVDLLDHAGPDAFTMRALAQRLGVGTMAVYSHFKAKDEIIDAVRERLLAEVELPTVGSGRTPRDELRELCRAVYRLLADHPSVLHLLTVRPVHGDEGTAVVERILGLLLGAGLDRSAAARAQTALMQYTVGAALWTARGRQRSGDQEDPGTRLRTRFAALPAERYPHLVDLAPELAAAQDGLPQYEHGLDALLSGLLAGH
ncbi:TetR/AcrR family transcriptional regulator [Streptantibioticus ferralitis]|uniref:TetR/AcrR family transcriptional regulator C-terminal domain-containing protein n=1 Tax=Streptantibioticus ferralitis TaxID=236510 RepID=A0ABT5YX19_9ACTN|nr:TetR/AcrR family transcriptional regulator C-terminal domain-containing protein [Streptantibioticus ferralitis]MDF2255390.1 TetR/AcrR family transcriptional regulator C-terminal domain-containing protein [Streptantibioticus ferralitis]